MDEAVPRRTKDTMKKMALDNNVYFRPMRSARIPATKGAIKAPIATRDPTQDISFSVTGRPIGLSDSFELRNAASGDGQPRVVPTATLDKFTAESSDWKRNEQTNHFNPPKLIRTGGSTGLSFISIRSVWRTSAP